MPRREPSDPSAALARVQAGFTGGATGVLEALKTRRESQQRIREILLEGRLRREEEAAKPENILKLIGLQQALEVGRTATPPGGFSHAEMEQPQLEEVFAPVRRERMQRVAEQFGLIKPQLSLGEEIVKAQELSAARARGTGVVKFGEKARQDFAKLSSLESSLGELQFLAGDVRKGPIKGRFISLVSNLTGGGEAKGLGITKSEAESANIYNRIKPGAARGFYRTLTGDDRISDLDATAAALPFLPDFKQAPGAFGRQLQIMQRALSNRRQSIVEAQRLGLDPLPLQPSEFLSLMRQSERELTTSVQSFASLEEADAANLPSGTQVVINGRRAVVE